MFARVVDAQPTSGGRTNVLLEQAAISDVLDNVRIDFDEDVTPDLVDATGRVVIPGRSGRLTLGQRQNTLDNWYECSESGGMPRSASQVWSTGSVAPLEIAFENNHLRHAYDSGWKSREPFLTVWWRTEIVASAKLRAKTGFKCEVSDDFRRHHRLRFRMGSIAGVPINANLELAAKFEVSAAGTIKVSQRHYLTLGFRQEGTEPTDAIHGYSRDPIEGAIGAALDASFFIGPDVSIMLGGGYKTANAQAGLYGQIGPEVHLTTSTDQPGCVTATGRLAAELGLRLELWNKRWDLSPISFTGEESVLGGPWCALADPAPTGHIVDRDADIEPFRYEPDPLSLWLTLPAADGWWLAGENIEGGWRYRWLSPAGEATAVWTSSGDPMAFGRGDDGAVFLAESAPDEQVKVVRIGETGPELERLAPRASDPTFALAGGPDGDVYWYAELKPASGRPSGGAFRLDPLSLEPVGYAPFSASNPVLAATRTGLTLVDYNSSAERAPYERFTWPAQTEPPIMAMPALHGAFTHRRSIGETGTIVDIGFPYNDFTCDGKVMSGRHPDGETWTRALAAADVGGITDCTVADIDTMPDGGAAATLRGSNGLWLLWLDSSGARVALERIAEHHLNATSDVDATGILVTAYTHKFTCNPPAADRCSEARVQGNRASGQVFARTITEPGKQTSANPESFGGRPSLKIADGQVGVEVIEAVTNGCEIRELLAERFGRHATNDRRAGRARSPAFLVDGLSGARLRRCATPATRT
jgi:hypothetical protein